ncbi:TSUP family transporter [Paludicola sp. MB14-C6]|uniref:sulfite exporter TauE/SafE family protein n=1 Tax=Paludihabitans sp. MB14-C6 TaxID=3070656 RepID=UPI0027DCB3EA|nr:TSUP family transporter [Paludicola sp. MB14-C6]WMJ23873.1 TSUP family transporter [Paludicola sp. MB14-C6]
MNETLQMLLIICPFVFTAGFVDAVAGGGGIIALPAYLFAGLPAHFAAGCNKFSSSFGTLVATLKYIKSGKVRFRIAIYSAIGAMVGSYIGTSLVLFIKEPILRIMMLVALPLVAVFLLFQKKLGIEPIEKQFSAMKQAIISIVIGLFIGCYDGLLGPGTGTFLILAFSGILGFDLVLSSGCAKVSNLASNITSMIIFLIGGKVLFLLAIPAAACSMFGGYLGARFAVKHGAKFVRYIMFVVLGLLFIKTAYDFFIR